MKFFCDSCYKEVIGEELKHCKQLGHEISQIPDNEENQKSKNSEKQTQENPKNIEELYFFAKQNILQLTVSQDDNNAVYAKIQNSNHIEPLKIDSEFASNWLMYHHRINSKKIYAYESYKNALKHVKSEALFDGSKREKIHLRIAQTENAIYYDLGRSDWEIIRITSQNYITLPYSESNPVFERRPGIAEQAIPNDVDKTSHVNALDELCEMFGISGDDKIIFKVHVVHFFLERQESPIMVIIGEHGSRKSTLMNAIKKLVDPSSSNTGSISSRKEEIPHVLSNKYLCAFDNVSGFNHEVSDILCRAITGDEISRRALYTNNDLFVTSYQRKIIINGIYPSIEFPDFNDRTFYYELTPINDKDKISKSEFWKKFDELIPYLLNQIFQTLSKTFTLYEKIGMKIKPKSRLADFEKYGEVISQALGYKENDFLDAYRNKRKSLLLINIDSWPIVKLIIDFMKSQPNYYENYLSDFYKTITEKAEDYGINTRNRNSNWPQKSQFLTLQINRLKPQFRHLGLRIEVGPYTKRDGKFDHGLSVISIQNIEKLSQPALSSRPEQASGLSVDNNGKDDGLLARTVDSSLLPETNCPENKKSLGHAGQDDKDVFRTICCKTCNTVFKTSKSLDEITQEHNKSRDPSHHLEYDSD